MAVKAIHIEAHVFPTDWQDTPAGKEEVARIREFTNRLEALAQEMLPGASFKMTITEERQREVRGGR